MSKFDKILNVAVGIAFLWYIRDWWLAIIVGGMCIAPGLNAIMDRKGR